MAMNDGEDSEPTPNATSASPTPGATIQQELVTEPEGAGPDPGSNISPADDWDECGEWPPVDALYHSDRYIVVNKPEYVRIDGDFPCTLEKMMRS
eukprot:gene5591-5560_t